MAQQYSKVLTGLEL